MSYNRHVILTKRYNDKTACLKQRLGNRDGDLIDIPIFTRENLQVSPGCEYVFSIGSMPEMTEKEIAEYLPNLKAIFYAGGTVKYFAEPFLKRGIRIFSAEKINGLAVAEFTLAQILLANKGYFYTSRKYRFPIKRSKYQRLRKISKCHVGNFNSTVGIIGYGNIGRKVAELLKTFDITIKIHSSSDNQNIIKGLTGVGIVSLEEIFESCDVVSCHLPDIESTKKMISESLLQRMKPYATLINTGRGAQIDEKALCKVFKKRKDLTALLDVTIDQPPAYWSPLLRLDNVFLSPHIAGSLNNEFYRIIDFIYDSYRHFISGQTPEGELTLDMLRFKTKK